MTPACVLGRREDGLACLTIMDMNEGQCDNTFAVALTDDEILELAEDLISLVGDPPPMEVVELQATLVQAKLAMVRYRNALQMIRTLARFGNWDNIERIAAIALRERLV